jgi:hypothetical protein
VLDSLLSCDCTEVALVLAASFCAKVAACRRSGCFLAGFCRAFVFFGVFLPDGSASFLRREVLGSCFGVVEIAELLNVDK